MPLLIMVEGVALDYNLHFRVTFGEFLQTFEGRDNTMKPRTIDAIAMGPTVNFQEGIRCFILVTEKYSIASGRMCRYSKCP